MRAGDFAICDDGSLLAPEKGVDAYLTQHYLTVATSGSTLIHASSKAGKTVEQDVSDYFPSSLNRKSSYILVDLGLLLQ